jgi:multicomponent Na+:H+ antiporter subunit A
VSGHALPAGVVFAPFLALPLAAWLGGRGAGAASALALIPAALTGLLVHISGVIATAGPRTAEIPWIPGLNLRLAFRFDGLGVFFAVLIVAVGTLIVLYAARYLDGHRDARRFHVSLFAFMGSMLGVVLSDDVIALFVFWELTGFTSYLLIGFDHDRVDARRAALQAWLVTGAGGLALLAAGVLLAQATGTSSLSAMPTVREALAAHPAYGAIAILVLLAAFTKSAQFPFHFWLPNAMEAPTPVSAYLHSATMVKAGVYLIARTTPVLGGTELWTITVATTGAVTMVAGAYRALLETDLKRVLAYSTISALGILVLLLGIGTPAAVIAALAYVLAHAAYKGALFLVAGTIEHVTGTRDVTGLGGLAQVIPATALAAGLAAASMAGAPLTLGFIAKEQLYEAAGGVALAAAVIASALLGAAGLIAGLEPFTGRTAGTRGAHAPSPALWLPSMVLGIAGVILGLVPGAVNTFLQGAAASVVGAPVPVNLAIWHGFTPTFALSLLTLIAAGALFAGRTVIRTRAYGRTFNTVRLYTGALRCLDRVSAAIAPLLQAGSLRAYLLVIVVAAVALVGAGLATGGHLPAPARWTSIRAHEALVIALVVAAALSAARARSAMAAVLCLGTVGYGVALLYALFGGPDLAMTQFAVETLTVVIFVLVFRDMRGFADLSTRRVKIRDAIVAGAAGAVITTLVLFIGASGTTSRLSSFFAEAAPSLAHGRNVVNVILVDFRALDTMGEVTVLVTVALGVRALISIGAGRRP